MSEAEIIKSISFYGFGLLVLIFSILTVFAKKVIYSIIFAVIAFFCTAGIFFSLGADYNAVVQIAVYGVAVPVILLFAIMFTSRSEAKTVYLSFTARFFTGIISLALFLMIIWYSIKYAVHLNSSVIVFFAKNKIDAAGLDSIYSISNTLYVNYRLALFLFGIMILTVIVGLSVLNIIKEQRRG